MRNIIAIAGRELRASFVTPLAYVIIASFLIVSGFFFFSRLQWFNTILQQAALMPDVSPNLNQEVIVPLYQTLEIILIFLVPVLTMRALAEERQTGTFELLATSPISVNEIVIGKFLGLGSVVVIMLSLVFVYPLAVILFADPEVPPIVIGFAGILMFSLSFVAIGIAVSACTRSQTVAGVISLVSCLLLYVINIPAPKLGEAAEAVLNYIAPSTHTEMLFKGVLQGSDIVYFGSVCVVGLFITARVLDVNRWR